MNTNAFMTGFFGALLVALMLMSCGSTNTVVVDRCAGYDFVVELNDGRHEPIAYEHVTTAEPTTTCRLFVWTDDNDGYWDVKLIRFGRRDAKL